MSWGQAKQTRRNARFWLNYPPIDCWRLNKVNDADMAEACLAGLWLHHSFLAESHELSQELHSAEGSYWHAIMHRREPDYENSKYWFRRVANHEIFPALAEQVEQLVPPSERSFAGPVLNSNKWDPFAFVDLCRQARSAGAAEQKLCQQIQQIEWRLLFAHCYARAAAS